MQHLVLVSIGIFTILGLGVFCWDNVKRAKENIFHVAKDTCEDAFKPTVDSPIGSGSISNIKKCESEPRILLESEGQERGNINRLRGYEWRTKVDDAERC
jgi:hypothetical protein